LFMADEDNKPDIASLRIDHEKRQSDRPRSRKWMILIWIVAIAAIVIAYFLTKERITPATKVKVATVTLITGSDAQAALVATGYVVAQRKAEVASKGTGRLVYLGFEEGDTVTSGEVIARLDNDDVRANLELAKAELTKAEADSLNAGRSYRRAKNLFASGSITETEYENAETAYRLALASVTAAAANVKAAEVALENTYIRAPFDGTILTKNADVGEMVAPFASSASSKGSVVTLADMNSLEVEADVSESNIHKVSVGQRCEIILDAYPDIRYAGHVKKIVPTADRSRATVLTKVAFTEKDDRVLPEMSARVNFFFDDTVSKTTEQRPVVAVPKDAITTRDEQKVVFTVKGEYVTAAPVQIGRELGAMTEILSGVQQGEQVVLSPPGKMTTGQKVQISY
jgi:RND family efflux transporter MFP subunit